MIYNLTATVIAQREIISNYWQIIIKATPVARFFSPGQFVTVQCGPGPEPLLKRPLGIYQADVRKGTITLIYKVVGSGTRQLTTARAGDKISLIGPLGKGFPVSVREKKIILVAGGLGIVPLFSLAQKITEKKFKTSLELFWGASSRAHFFNRTDLTRLRLNKIRLATADGSAGFTGNITEVLEKNLSEKSADLVCACGPTAMLKKVADLSRRFKIPARVSLEARMACGFGVCLGCAVATRSGYKNVCDEGPVFDAGEIVWS